MNWIFRNGRRIRVFLSPNADGGTGWDEGDWKSDTGSSDDTSWDDTGKKDEGKKTPDNVPYDRFKEVNDANKAMKAKLAEYEKKEAEEAEKKKKADEEEAKKKGEFEKLLTQKDQELADFKKQQEAWKEREETLKSRNTERVEALKKDLWENWKDAESLISDIDDPFKLSSKLDSLEKLYASKKSSKSTGGSDMPSWEKKEGELAELQERANKGEYLTAWEQARLLQLARSKREGK